MGAVKKIGFAAENNPFLTSRKLQVTFQNKLTTHDSEHEARYRQRGT